MNKLQEKLDFLLEKYSVDVKAEIKDDKTVMVNGKEYPTLPHRSERRFIELKNIANNGTLEGISVMRVARIVRKGSRLLDALEREMDLCQWILSDSIASVTAVQNDNVMNIIATTKKGIVCTIELSATLKDGDEPIDKHEIIARRGTACDVVVDAQLKQDSIYVFGGENKKYTDVDFELYGLKIDEIAAVRSAFALVQKGNYEENSEAYESAKKLAEAAAESVKAGERIVID